MSTKQDMDPLSATFLSRIPLGTLRLGVGDLTILDAYSVAQMGDKRLRSRLERAYNETSDLGLIGTTLCTQGHPEGTRSVRRATARDFEEAT